MGFTNSGARELRKEAAASVAELAPLLKGVSGLSQKAKVKNLKKAKKLALAISEALTDAHAAAKSV